MRDRYFLFSWLGLHISGHVWCRWLYRGNWKPYFGITKGLDNDDDL